MTHEPGRSGILLVDKPVGPTSHDVVAVARRALGIRKVGHTGTLDPFASGLLVLCYGRATRVAEFLVGLDKAYEAVARLGVATDSFDHLGEVVSEDDAWVGVEVESVEQALDRLGGSQLQVPPSYSAIKVGGTPAHRRVRRGEEVTLEARPVRIDVLELDWLRPPELGLTVVCSSGTYVRSLARDLGEHLGTGCHLTALRRTRVGALQVESAASLDDLRSGHVPQSARVGWRTALAHIPEFDVSGDQARRLAMGQTVEHTGPDADVGAIYHENDLVAMAEVAGGRIKPRKVLVGG